MELQDIATRLGLALALGFVIGLERGWRERDEKEGQRAAGIRTFSLIGLLGGLFATLSPGSDHVLLAAGFIATSTVMGAFIWREHAREGVYGATTMIAALVTFVLGAVAVLGDMRVAAGAGVVTVGLLAYKSTLHGFLARITSQELRSALLLAAMTFIALPLLPDGRAVIPHEVGHRQIGGSPGPSYHHPGARAVWSAGLLVSSSQADGLASRIPGLTFDVTREAAASRTSATCRSSRIACRRPPSRRWPCSCGR